MTRTLRLGLAALAASAALVGVPALLLPRTFYDDFPFVGHWVDRVGPYNEHLTTDVGTLYLAVAALFAWAAARGARDLAAPLLAVWLVAGLVHLGFHVTHLDGFPTSDAVAQTISLALVPLVCGLLLPLALRPGPSASGSPGHRRPG